MTLNLPLETFLHYVLGFKLRYNLANFAIYVYMIAQNIGSHIIIHDIDACQNIESIKLEQSTLKSPTI